MPESLAPALGRLGAPQRDTPFDPVRLALVDTLVSALALGPLSGAAWLDAWQHAMEAIRDEVVTDANASLERAAARSRLPAARLAQLRPDAELSVTLLNRLLAEGEPLERLDRLAAGAAADRARGAALQTAWDAAARVALAERAHWAGISRDVENWRRPWWPLVITASVTLILAALLAALLGGVLPSPAWFQPVITWFWGLPWL
jgi:hypothetical protein